MSRAIEKLTKTVEEKDFQIANLINKLESKKGEESKSCDMDDANEALKQFDGKGNLRQHVAHFIETCNIAGTEGDLLVKQFVQSLKGNTFDWYTDLEFESIDCWKEMEREFQNRFYSTRRSVSMMELTNTKKRKDEPVVDYINIWRALSLDCEERISEASAVEMCMQGMHWGLFDILQDNRPDTLRSWQHGATTWKSP
ncbi:hypothetical protein RJ639_002651 [Escallonia herrerae]|uniref:Retrotransposon gag domain-containing protein n=1 Tax=Escallonia herrerae TaxID=1293975 RepID=A0AA89BGW2_9ASTE|nr:hypothetical protein RJ639_002651 [Escallonia herrerae]